MTHGLLGAHINATATGIPETIARWKPPIVVLLDHSDVWHDVKSESPDSLFVGRLFMQQEPNFNDPSLDPRKAARDHCDKVLPWAERMGETYDYWQGVNEPIISSSEAMKRCADFDAERVRIMDENGYRVVVGSFSVGNPEFKYWKDFLPALEAARQRDGAMALHEYAWPTLDHKWPWYLLRHRKVYNGDPDRGWDGLPEHLKTLPLLVTESGLDGLIEKPHPPRGWRVLYRRNPVAYLRQLDWYDIELQKDPYVVGAAIYCCGTPDSTWKSYDIWPGIAKTLAKEAKPIYRLAATEPTGPSQPTEPVAPLVPPTMRWDMTTKYRAGPRIIAGSLPEAGIRVTITDPWGNASTVESGSKLEYGEGGFEVLTPHIATYTISFLGEDFRVKTRDRATFLTFVKVAVPPVEPEPVVGEPEEPQGPTVPTPSPVDALTERDMLDLLAQRLDRIIDAIQQRL